MRKLRRREAILIGQTLSHYKIVSALGAGGMGEVYRATDMNLHRDVAIKVLPPEVVQDPERLGRFKREAHLLAALNHPSIAAIYGLEEADGKPFLALELVEGEVFDFGLAKAWTGEGGGSTRRSPGPIPGSRSRTPGRSPTCRAIPPLGRLAWVERDGRTTPVSDSRGVARGPQPLARRPALPRPAPRPAGDPHADQRGPELVRGAEDEGAPAVSPAFPITGVRYRPAPAAPSWCGEFRWCSASRSTPKSPSKSRHTAWMWFPPFCVQSYSIRNVGPCTR